MLNNYSKEIQSQLIHITKRYHGHARRSQLRNIGYIVYPGSISSILCDFSKEEYITINALYEEIYNNHIWNA